jgi:cytochrome c556
MTFYGGIMKKLTALVAAMLCIATSSTFAQQDAEALVASKQPADMTYRELMQIFSHALATMQDGVLRQNREMVKQGANFILTHPAPKHKPWTIMAPADQEGFKQALLTYDKVLDATTTNALKTTGGRDWQGGIEAIGELQRACVSCHAVWKDKAIR